MALSKRNTNAAEIILFLHRLVQVLVEYFKELEEESIRDNFVIIYELMDEMMDFGFPQTTESKILQECVHYPLSRVRVTFTPYAQVHHPRVVQARGPGAAAHRCHQCRVMAIRGYSVPEERSVLGRYRERQLACELRFMRCAVRTGATNECRSMPTATLSGLRFLVL